MAIFAMYVPKAEQMTQSLSLLLLAFCVLCACARKLHLSILIVAIAMAACGVLFVLPDVLAVLSDPHLPTLGAQARAFNNSEHSNAFFGVTAYMYVGRGQLMAFAGMSAALLTFAVIQAVFDRCRGRTSRAP